MCSFVIRKGTSWLIKDTPSITLLVKCLAKKKVSGIAKDKNWIWTFGSLNLMSSLELLVPLSPSLIFSKNWARIRLSSIQL